VDARVVTRTGDVVADRFELATVVRRRGQSVVYRAVDREIGAPVAIEVHGAAGRRSDTTVDGSVVARLDHPRIARYVAHGVTAAGEPWLATEWLEGVDLGQEIARRAPSLAEALQIGAHVSDALTHAHGRGVTHGQLDPARIFLVGGTIDDLKVLGFGSAPFQSTEPSESDLSSLGYVAPELARGWRASPAADVFSLGCILYRLVAGRPPFDAESLGAIVVSVLTRDPPPLGTLVPVPGAIESLVHAMLAKDPSARPDDAASIRQTLLRSASSTAAARTLTDVTTIRAGDAAGCPSEARLAAYLEGIAAGAERDEVERHIDVCADCARLVGEYARSTRTPAPISAAAATLGIGATIGRYTIEDVLGMGAVGIVYLARDRHLHRQVALKIVLHTLDGERAYARMLREARALAQLSHPNVVTVYDTGYVGARPYLVLEYVPGRRLDVWLRERPRARDEAGDALLQAGEGLAAAHEAGLVHRDVKPANVMVGDDGRVRVVDFGLVRIDPADPRAGFRTTLGAFLGTPYYMAPEQRFGSNVDARADQYAFSIMALDTLYRDGRPAGDGAAALTDDPRDALLAVIRRGMAARAADRHPSMRAMVAELRAALARDRADDAAPLTIPMAPDTLAEDTHFVLVARPPQGALAAVPLRNLTHTLVTDETAGPGADAARELATRGGGQASVLPNGLLLARFRPDPRFRESAATRAAHCALALAGVLGIHEVAVVAEDAGSSDVRGFERANVALDPGAQGAVPIDERVAAAVQHELRVERNEGGWLLFP
jgi:eukaryotic-like serine/threonine-protein kinase